jgi:hypothetical protein
MSSSGLGFPSLRHTLSSFAGLVLRTCLVLQVHLLPGPMLSVALHPWPCKMRALNWALAPELPRCLLHDVSLGTPRRGDQSIIMLVTIKQVNCVGGETRAPPKTGYHVSTSLLGFLAANLKRRPFWSCITRTVHESDSDIQRYPNLIHEQSPLARRACCLSTLQRINYTDCLAPFW